MFLKKNKIILLYIILIYTHGVRASTSSVTDNGLYTDEDVKQPAGSQCSCIVGLPGAPGVPGVPGVHGARGLDGEKGKTGEKGAEGQKGQRGSKGDQGIKGDIGPMGPPGFAGNMRTSDFRFKSRPKVAFSVVSRLKLGPVASDAAVIFDTVFYNAGNGFDVTTSKFNCPVSGAYLINAHILSQLQLDVYAWIMVNDKHQLPLHGNGRAGHGSDSQTVILPLKSGDMVWVLMNKDSATFNDYSTFSGFLLYENDNNDQF